ncbi:MAG: ComF family protein [Mucinivorans sp.]
MIRQWLSDLGELLFPPLCAVCGRALVSGEKVICTTCRWDMPLTDYWSIKDNYLSELLAGRVDFTHASALMFFKHQSSYRELIHRMKYGGRRDVAYTLGLIYGQYLSESQFYSHVDMLIPIPLHWTRRIKRGYNQSELICRGMAHSMGVECCTGAVRRVRRTKTQAQRRGQVERWRNVEGAFAVVHPEKLQGRCVMLVDDVITTGSTTEACAHALSAQSQLKGLWVGALAVVRSTKPINSIAPELLEGLE